MVALMIKNPNLPSGYEILNTSWWLSSTPDFGELDIIAISIEDEVNLLNIQFDVDLEVGRKYYAKCRVVYNKGFSNESNINVFTARDLNEINLDLVTPTKISRPTITILPEGDVKPIGLLKFEGGPFVTKFDVEHSTSSWILEDIKTNKVLWSKIEDAINLTSVDLPVTLDPNSAFRMTLAYRGKNGNLSQFATKTFVTGANDVKIKGDLTKVPADIDLPIEVDVLESGITTVTYRLYANGSFLIDSLLLSSAGGGETRKYTIDGDLISTGVDYTLHIEILESTGIKRNGYFYFKPYFDLSLTPDPNFKYENKVKEFAPTYTVENFSNSTGYRPELPNNEVIQIVSRDGNISLDFFKLDSTNGRFDYTGRSYTLGVLRASAIAVDTSFSYCLLKNGRLIIKGHRTGLLLSIPYNIVSGELDVSTIRFTYGLGELSSTARLQHAIVALPNSTFIAFSPENGRLVLVNSLDLSFTFLGSKVYDSDRSKIGIYKLTSKTMMVMYKDLDNIYKADIFNIDTNALLHEGIIILDESVNPSNIRMVIDAATANECICFKVVTLFNGNVIIVLSDTSNNNLYMTYNLALNVMVPLITKEAGIDRGVYSLLRNGTALQMNEVKEMIFY